MTALETVAVVGAGPCGVAAALQLRRQGIQPLLFEQHAVGGLLHNANLVENYPGFPSGLAGPLLCNLLERHLREGGVKPIFEKIVSVTAQVGGYALRTVSGKTHSAGAVLMATGTRPIKGILAEEEALAGRFIFYEVREILTRTGETACAVLGGGDAAYDYALNLASRGYRVSLLQRGASSCLPLLAERVASHPHISVRKGARVISLSEKKNKLDLIMEMEKEILPIRVDFLLIACGRIPEDGLLKGLADGLEEDRLQVGEEAPGIFCGGDLVRGNARQAGIAVGDGLWTAMAAARYLYARRGEKENKVDPKEGRSGEASWS